MLITPDPMPIVLMLCCCNLVQIGRETKVQLTNPAITSVFTPIQHEKKLNWGGKRQKPGWM